MRGTVPPQVREPVPPPAKEPMPPPPKRPRPDDYGQYEAYGECEEYETYKEHEDYKEHKEYEEHEEYEKHEYEDASNEIDYGLDAWQKEEVVDPRDAAGNDVDGTGGRSTRVVPPPVVQGSSPKAMSPAVALSQPTVPPQRGAVVPPPSSAPNVVPPHWTTVDMEDSHLRGTSPKAAAAMRAPLTDKQLVMDPVHSKAPSYDLAAQGPSPKHYGPHGEGGSMVHGPLTVPPPGYNY